MKALQKHSWKMKLEQQHCFFFFWCQKVFKLNRGEIFNKCLENTNYETTIARVRNRLALKPPSLSTPFFQEPKDLAMAAPVLASQC